MGFRSRAAWTWLSRPSAKGSRTALGLALIVATAAACSGGRGESTATPLGISELAADVTARRALAGSLVRVTGVIVYDIDRVLLSIVTTRRLTRPVALPAA